MIAEVIVNSNVKSLNKVFDYNIPQNLEDKVAIGSIVLIPFGRNKKLEEGFVTNIKESTSFEVKDIAGVEKASLTEEKIALSKWMAKKYFSNIAECMKLMLKPGTTSKNFANRISEKQATFAKLKISKEELSKYIADKKIKSEKQIAILNFLMSNESAQVTEIIEKTDTSRAIIKT